MHVPYMNVYETIFDVNKYQGVQKKTNAQEKTLRGSLICNSIGEMLLLIYIHRKSAVCSCTFLKCRVRAVART